MEMRKGKLLILEAGDGCGKATQTRLLVEALIKEGHKVRKVSFPNYDSPAAGAIKMYLAGEFGQHAADVNPYAAASFYAVDRFASYHTDWGEFYRQGGIVIADRYATSNMVHQAVKVPPGEQREAFLKWLWELEFEKFSLPVPDAVFFLDVPPALSAALIAARESEQRKRDIHEQDTAYLDSCYSLYRQLAVQYGWQQVNCAPQGKLRCIEEIHKEILNKALALCAWDS